MQHLGASALRGTRRLLPQMCALCGAASGGLLLCVPCGASLPGIACACPVCALPAAPGSVCGDCLARPPPFGAAVAAWVYAFPVDRLVHAFKYGGQLALAEPLALALIGALARR